MDTFVEGVFPTLAALTSLLLKLHGGQVDYAAATTFFFWVRVGPPVIAGLVIVLVLLIALPFSHKSNPGRVLKYTETDSPASEEHDSLQMSDQKRRSSCLILCCCEASDNKTVRRRDKRRVTLVESEEEDVIVENPDFKDSDDDVRMITTSFAAGFLGDDHKTTGFHGDDAVIVNVLKDEYYMDEVPLEFLPSPKPVQGIPSVTGIEKLSFSNHEYYHHSDNAYDSADEMEPMPPEGVGSIISSSESDSAIAPPLAPKNSAKQSFKPWFMAPSPTSNKNNSNVSNQSSRYNIPRADTHLPRGSVNVNVNYKLGHVKQTNGIAANGTTDMGLITGPLSDGGSMVSLNCDNGTDFRPSQKLPPPESTISRSLKKNSILRANLSRSDFKVIDEFTHTMERLQSGMKQENASQLQATILSLERIVSLEHDGEGTEESTRSVNLKQPVENLDNIMSDIAGIMGDAWTEPA